MAVILAAIAQMPLAAVMAEMPAANQTSPSEQARGPMDLGSMDEAIRSTPINLPWNDLAPSRSLWASFEYLGMWTKGSHVAASVTSTSNGNPLLQEGAPRPSGGIILPGDQRLDADMLSGERITAGAWLGDGIGVEASFFSLQPETAHFTTAVNVDAR